MYSSTSSLLKAFILVGTVSTVLCNDKAPKIIYKNFKSSYTVKEGGRVKLKCLVTGADDPEANRTLTAWRKDGVAKHRSVVRKSPMWARFKVKNCKYLRIRNVQKSDAGRYLCIAKNQHGMTHAFINLTVIPRSTNSTAVYNHITSEGRTRRPHPTAPDRCPRFRSKQTSHHAMKKAKGEELKLSCQAKGSPRPKVIWFKDRRPFKRYKNRFKLTSWGLTIKRLKHKDSGVYRCFVWNHFCNVTRTFYVQVLDDEPPKTTGSPVIQENLLKNATAVEGESVTFTCAALSDKKPQFAWVWISFHDSSYKVLNSSSSPNIRFQEMSRTVLGGTSYMQKIKLLNVSKSDQGQYACLVGHDGRKIVSSHVFLTVRQLKPTVDLTEVQGLTKNTSETPYLIGGVEIPLAAVIAVPVALFTLLIVAIIWCYVQIVKHRYLQYAKAAAFAPGPNGVMMNGTGHQNVHKMETFTNGHILHRTTPTPEVRHQQIKRDMEGTYGPEVKYEPEMRYHPELKYEEVREKRTRDLEECHSQNNIAISTENSLESCDRTTKSLDITDEESSQDIPSEAPNNLSETISLTEAPSEVPTDEPKRTDVKRVEDIHIDNDGIRDSLV